jgi:putative membrane protein insertion efficiency factor
MGHRNSSPNCHEEDSIHVNAIGAGRFAAEPSTVRIESSGWLFGMKTPTVAPKAEAPGKNPRTWPASLLLVAIRFYQAVFGPLMPVGCKFYPSCSRYAAEAVERYGVKRGVRLALARLWRCRPFTKGGVDLVPDLGEAGERADGVISEVHS